MAARAIQVTCPRCGAALRVGGDAVDVVCEYCGTPARVQRRTRVLDRVLPPPPAAGHPEAIARQARSVAGAVAAVVVLSMVGGVAVAIAVLVSSLRTGPTGRTSYSVEVGGETTIGGPRGERTRTWHGVGGAILVDLDGDGTLDVIGRRRDLSPDAIYVVALDGRTGAERWVSPALGTYEQLVQGRLALAGDALLVTTRRGELRALELATGAERWTATMPERAAALCADAPGVVAVLGADGARRRHALADGQALDAPAEAPPRARPRDRRRGEPCDELPHDGDGGDPRSRRADADRDLLRRHDLWSGAVAAGAAGRVVAGRRATGTGVPRLVALDERDGARWSVEVPTDPLGAEERAPDLVAVGDDVACASWRPTGKAPVPRLACFELADGRRRWDEPLAGDSPLQGLHLTPSLALVSRWGVLEAREIRTGALRWRYGGARR